MLKSLFCRCRFEKLLTPDARANRRKAEEIYVKMLLARVVAAARLKLFIGLAFHTIFVIFLSAQTYLIIIIFLCVYFFAFPFAANLFFCFS